MISVVHTGLRISRHSYHLAVARGLNISTIASSTNPAMASSTSFDVPGAVLQQLHPELCGDGMVAMQVRALAVKPIHAYANNIKANGIVVICRPSLGPSTSTPAITRATTRLGLPGKPRISHPMSIVYWESHQPCVSPAKLCPVMPRLCHKWEGSRSCDRVPTRLRPRGDSALQRRC